MQYRSEEAQKAYMIAKSMSIGKTMGMSYPEWAEIGIAPRSPILQEIFDYDIPIISEDAVLSI